MKRTYNFLLLVAFVLHFLTTSSLTISNNNTRDLNALLAFKASIVFAPQNTLSRNWSTSISVCNWIGITCNARHGRVATIHLPDMGLIGTIPPHLGNLSFLVKFNITNNAFHGELPKELANLRRLKYLVLAANNFVGSFPLWLGGLIELRFLSLRDNKFSGSLSRELSNATKLETIALANNALTGNLPEEFSYLKNLKYLHISDNKLSGSFQQALFNLSSLQVMAFANNSLSGYLPARICDQLPQLKALDLSWNEIQGEIPSGIGECSNLEFLGMSYNNIVGKIPRGIWNLTTLTTLYLGRLGIEGILPQEISNLHKLEILFLSENRFKGSIPLQLFNISTLDVISLGANELSGNLPSTLGLMVTNLGGLYLGNNNLSGKILTHISNASRLYDLELGNNNFSGAIPDALGNLRFLETLSLGGNHFTYESQSGELSLFGSLANCKNLKFLRIRETLFNGYLPFSIGNLSTSLESIDLISCGIKGEIPSSIGNLSNLVDLYLFNNSFEGMIPATIIQLQKLQRIYFGANKLQGPIPSEFCHLSNLGTLSLDVNELFGTVPSCLENISTSLRYLYLGTNRLNSSLPSNLWNLSNILDLDLSINSFTGPLPFQLGKLRALVSLNLSMNQFYGEIPSTIGGLEKLQALSLAHNNLTGSIPESMKGMLDLQNLDLSFNSLDGIIPISLEVLRLRHFNVSYNKLRGPIPHGGPFRNFTNLSFLSNEALCGAPWFQPCQTFEHWSKKKKKMVLFVLLAIGLVVLALTNLIMLIRKLRRKTTTQIQNSFLGTSFQRVSFHELRQMTNGFSDSNLLGSGTFGSVYKGIQANGVIWAIKVFDLKLERAFRSFDKECEVLRKLRHRNLAKVISTCSNPDFKALILEYMPNGSLERWLYSNDHFLDFKQRLDIMIDVACGLDYLHHGYSVPVVHCDLKPSNILIDQDMVGHVSDFGIAKLLGDGENVVQTETLATFGYIAPEYGQQGMVSIKCDVYGFGITLMETFTRRKPNDEMFSGELSIRQWIQESLPNSISQIIDVNLLQPEDELTPKNIACVSSVLQLALSCTIDAPTERSNMNDTRVALEKIKFQLSSSA